jgi:hypothetical protein
LRRLSAILAANAQHLLGPGVAGDPKSHDCQQSSECHPTNERVARGSGTTIKNPNEANPEFENAMIASIDLLSGVCSTCEVFEGDALLVNLRG